MEQTWTEALAIEQRVQEIVYEQETTGVVFDRDRASFLMHTVREKLLELYREIRPHLHPVYTKWSSVVKVYKADGEYTKRYLNLGIEATGSFCRVDWVEPDIGKRLLVIKQLKELGWEPNDKELTDKGTPRLTIDAQPVESLEKIEGIGKPLSLYYKYKHRLSQIQGFYKHLYQNKDVIDHDEWRISAGLDPLGTNTHRATHRRVVNIPKAASYVLLGRQMRGLFTIPKGPLWGPVRERRPYRMIGTDAAGLELRVLAHYINDDEYTKEITDGDAHSRHQEMAGLPTRDDAKTFLYAFMYGAGDAKIGSIIGSDAKAGKAIKARFLRANPKLDSLIQGVTRKAESGSVMAIDGRLIHMRRNNGRPMVHKALNTLLQSSGSILVKYGMVYLNDRIEALGLKTKQTIFYHDELALQVPIEEVDIMKELCLQWMEVAGKHLECKCPLASDSNVGLNWGDIH